MADHILRSEIHHDQVWLTVQFDDDPIAVGFDRPKPRMIAVSRAEFEGREGRDLFEHAMMHVRAYKAALRPAAARMADPFVGSVD